MDLLLIGMNHHVAPVEIREKVAFKDQEVAQLLHSVLQERFIKECLVISTCNRTEIYAFTDDPGRADQYLRQLVTDVKSVDYFLDPEFTYRHDDWEVVHHLFRVSCSLDSQIIGETQILSQIKHAYTLSIVSRILPDNTIC